MDIAYLIQRYCPGVTNPVLGMLWWAAMGVEEWRLYAAWRTGAFDWTCIAPMGVLLLALAVQAASCDGLLDVDCTRWGSFHPLLAVMMACGGLVSLAGGDSPPVPGLRVLHRVSRVGGGAGRRCPLSDTVGCG